MDHLRIVTAVEHGIHRQIFTEICHPSSHTQTYHVFLYQIFIPFIGFRICKVHHGCREGGNGDQIVLALFVFYTVTLGGSLFVYILFNGKEGIYIAQKPDSLLLPFYYLLPEIGIELIINYPVPHYLIAEAGPPASAPVLGPDAAYLCSTSYCLLDLFINPFGSLLNSQDGSVIDPVREGILSFRFCPTVNRTQCPCQLF